MKTKRQTPTGPGGQMKSCNIISACSMSSCCLHARNARAGLLLEMVSKNLTKISSYIMSLSCRLVKQLFILCINYEYDILIYGPLSFAAIDI